MSDPIKDLENFSDEGASMDPLAPSEVRRRGDRMRRRNHGMAALGTAAAVAVIAATGFLLPGGTDRGDEPGPVVDPSNSRTTEAPTLDAIPADFPLDVAMGGAQVTDTGEMDDLAYCGMTPLAGLKPAGVRSAQVAGGETLVTRTLYLLDDQDAARAAQTAVLNAASACAAEESPAGAVAIQPVDADWSGNTITLDLGPGAETEPTVQVVNVLSNGPAVLVTQIWGAWTGNVQAGVKDSRSGLKRLVAELDLFGESAGPLDPSDDASKQNSETTGPANTAPGDDIAADFPLAAGWPDDSTAETKEMGLEGPNRNLESLEFRACGKVLADPEHADRLRANWTNPEDYRTRQLTTYTDADEAVAAVADLIAAQKACPQDPERADGYETQRTVRRVEAGGEAWAILERDTMNGAASPFGASTLVIRTGHAVLVIQNAGHGGYPDGNGQSQIDALLNQAERPIAAMCAFTEAGCGSASTTVFGPDGHGSLHLGMTQAEVVATGDAELSDDDLGCQHINLVGEVDRRGHIDGYITKRYGLESLWARPGMSTPAGISIGSTLSELTSAYPDLDGSGGYYSVPISPEASYQFVLAADTEVTQMGMLSNPQSCVD